MEWLNYHHLLYFWTVVRSGSVQAAAAELRLSPSTVSEQLRSLEESLDEKLLRKAGRSLVPTDMGIIVFRYADEIFSIGKELLDTVHGRPSGRPMRLVVGVADVVPKFVIRQLLEPVRRMAQPVRLICREASADQLLARLSIQELDVILTDAPVGPTAKVRAYSHVLGESPTSMVAVPGVARRVRREFPQALDKVPMLLPADNTAVRPQLDRWLQSHNLRPQIAGEFEDFALLLEFGLSGAGVFPVPTVMERRLQRESGLSVVGRIPEVRARFYAISVERKIKHPAVIAISQSARRTFAAH